MSHLLRADCVRGPGRIPSPSLSPRPSLLLILLGFLVSEEKRRGKDSQKSISINFLGRDSVVRDSLRAKDPAFERYRLVRGVLWSVPPVGHHRVGNIFYLCAYFFTRLFPRRRNGEDL